MNWKRPDRRELHRRPRLDSDDEWKLSFQEFGDARDEGMNRLRACDGEDEG